MEQKNYGGKNYQINAKNIGHVGDVYHHTPDVEALLSRGKQLLQNGMYPQAIDVLNDAIKADPMLAEAHYRLAIASLKGRRPKGLVRDEVEAIDQSISSAATLEPGNGVYQLLRALVRDDYYEVNCLRSPKPSANTILSNIKPSSIDISWARELLEQLSAMENSTLYASLKRQLL